MDTKRNDPCPCGSGKKYKKCCGLKAAKSQQNSRSFYTGPSSKDPVKDLRSRIIKVLGSEESIIAPPHIPESLASTEQAEQPELAPPI